MRIVQVTDFFPPVRGGLETHVDDLATALADRGHDVHVVTLTADATPAHPDVTVHHVATAFSRFVSYDDPRRPFHPPLPDPAARRGLREVVTRLAPDVVHAHSWLGVSLPRRLAPVVFTAHDYATICQLHTLWRTDGAACDGPGLARCTTCAGAKYGAARAFMLGAGTAAGRRLLPADAVLTLSDYVRGRIAPYLRQPVECVGGFVPETGCAVELPALPDGAFVMYAGDPGPHKGLDLLLDVWSAPDQPAPLVVATTKPLDRAVPAGVTVVQLDRFQVRAAFARAAVVAVPSRWNEPYGMVAVEALAAGVPVVASRVGALGELVRDGIDGVLVEPGDAAALAQAIRRLLADGDLRAGMAVAAKDGAHRFAAATVVARIESVYERLVDKGRQR